MMKHQFLLTWLVLFCAVGVYSQLQQDANLNINDQGSHESHKRVARSGNQFAHKSSTASKASDDLYKNEEAKIYDRIERSRKQEGYPYGYVVDRVMYPDPAHQHSTASRGQLNVALYKSRSANGKYEYDNREAARDKSVGLQQKLKQQQQKGAYTDRRH